MENKVILITGGSSGVGKLLVHELSQKNKVITIARRLERLDYILRITLMFIHIELICQI